MKRPPRLEWKGHRAIVERSGLRVLLYDISFIYHGEGCRAICNNGWDGPFRKKVRTAQIDAEYHAAGRWNERKDK